MWLRHFLPKDLPNCRTLIYGYNSKLTGAGIHSTKDFISTFLDELVKSRVSEIVGPTLPPSGRSGSILDQLELLANSLSCRRKIGR